MNEYINQHTYYLKSYLHELLDLKVKFLLKNRYNEKQIDLIINKIHEEEKNISLMNNETDYTLLNFYLNLHKIFKVVKIDKSNELILKFILFNIDNNQDVMLIKNFNYKSFIDKINNYFIANNPEFIIGYSKEEQEKSTFYKSIYMVEYDINKVNDNNIDIIIDSIIDNIRFLKNNNNEKLVFNNFNSLTNLLNSLNLNGRVQLAILFYYLKLNINSKIFNDEYFIAIDTEDLKKHRFKYFKTKELNKIIKNGTLIKYLKISMFNKKKYLELKDFIEQYITYNLSYYNNLCTIYKGLEKGYFNNSNINESDIEMVINNLKKMDFNSISLNKLKALLLKQNIKKDEPKELPFKLGVVKVGKKINICNLSKKEYNLTIKEIKKYIDMDNMQLIKPINYEKLLYLIALLMKLKVDDNKINSVVNNFHKQINILDNFGYIITKLEYYKNAFNIASEIEELKESYNEYKYTNNLEEKEFWQNSIIELVNKIYKIINSNEYELNKAKMLLKVSN